MGRSLHGHSVSLSPFRVQGNCKDSRSGRVRCLWVTFCPLLQSSSTASHPPPRLTAEPRWLATEVQMHRLLPSSTEGRAGGLRWQGFCSHFSLELHSREGSNPGASCISHQPDGGGWRQGGHWSHRLALGSLSTEMNMCPRASFSREHASPSCKAVPCTGGDEGGARGTLELL